MVKQLEFNHLDALGNPKYIIFFFWRYFFEDHELIKYFKLLFLFERSRKFSPRLDVGVPVPGYLYIIQKSDWTLKF